MYAEVSAIADTGVQSEARRHYGYTATQSIFQHWTSYVKFYRLTKGTWKAVTDTWDGYHSVPLRHHAFLPAAATLGYRKVTCHRGTDSIFDAVQAD